MRIVFTVLGCLFAIFSLRNMANDEPEAARFTIIMCGIFAILRKMYS